jgi:hypothetical protein
MNTRRGLWRLEGRTGSTGRLETPWLDPDTTRSAAHVKSARACRIISPRPCPLSRLRICSALRSSLLRQHHPDSVRIDVDKPPQPRYRGATRRIPDGHILCTSVDSICRPIGGMEQERGVYGPNKLDLLMLTFPPFGIKDCCKIAESDDSVSDYPAQRCLTSLRPVASDPHSLLCVCHPHPRL